MLDDVLTSLDSGHRNRVADLLRQAFDEDQLILTSLDEAWYQSLQAKLHAIEEDFAREQLELGARRLGTWIECLPHSWYRQECDSILRDAGCKLQQHGYSRPEYILLAVHTLSEGLIVSTP